jgi:hypothetical protein
VDPGIITPRLYWPIRELLILKIEVIIILGLE